MVELRIKQLDWGQRLYRLRLRELFGKLKVGIQIFLWFKHGAISWRSKLEECTTTSTTKEEYVAASDAAKEALWLRRLTYIFRQVDLSWTSVVLKDNQEVVAFVKNPVHHNASNHIKVRYHFVRDCMTKGNLSLEKVSTDDNLTDVMIKGLSAYRFLYLRNSMGVEMILDQPRQKS